jgi:hypothetical protein
MKNILIMKVSKSWVLYKTILEQGCISHGDLSWRGTSTGLRLEEEHPF